MINNPMVPGDPGMYDLKKLVCMVLRHDGLLTGLDPIVQEKVRVAADALEGELNEIRNKIDELGDVVDDLEERVADKVSDVTIAGSSIVTDGVAEIPIATSNNVKGLHETRANTGITTGSAGQLLISSASEAVISGRNSGTPRYYAPIVPINLDYAVKAALTDGIGADYTPAEQKAARARLGFPVEWELKADVTNPASNSIACDMSGCTEMMIYVTGTNNAVSNLSARYADLTTGVILGTALMNGNRSTLAHYVSCNDICTIGNAKFVAALNSWALNGNGNAYGSNEPVGNIRQLGLTNANNSTNVHIMVYGR